MKVELELWQLITLLLTFLGACAGGGKLLLNQIQKAWIRDSQAKTRHAWRTMNSLLPAGRHRAGRAGRNQPVAAR
ncbi:hypothetical protein P4050_30635 [Pseudomonas aeruginosa]|nr:hypothetical protein [Pseudomonas aeruginosa]